MKKIINRMCALIRLTSKYIVSRNRFEYFARNSYYQKPLRIIGGKYIKIYENVSIKKYISLEAKKIYAENPEIVFGKGSVIGDFNHISAVKRIIIGEYVCTANGIYISDYMPSNYDKKSAVRNQAPNLISDVYIGDGTWIGENVAIMCAKIGKNCVIGANSVVTSDIPDYSVVVGNPGKIISNLKLKNMTRKREISKTYY
ncbi:MAG: acyltransferase [Candidatus Omnitrophota bacterium]|nr:acyltransferase [Candidatus Omnitrophota bacterium]